MAIFVATDYSVTLNTVDLSDHVKSCVLNYSAELQDDTVMSDTTRSRIGGLLDWSIDIEFAQDFAASKVDATLFSIVGTVFACVLVPTSSAVSATNPSFTGNGVLETYPPMGGAVGDLATTNITIQSAGTLTRATS